VQNQALPKLFFVLSSTCCYTGNDKVLGVFDSMKAVSARLEWVCDHDEDEYRIEGFQLTSLKDSQTRRDEILKNRADAKAKNEEKKDG